MKLRMDINEIETALMKVLEELRSQKGDLIDMAPADYYWSIDKDELYNPYAIPEHFTLGQLTDDLQELKKLAQGDVEPVALDLVKVRAVLAAIGHKTVW
ncbi:MAG: hypothetical protein IPN20_15100 [Haliscomenobacter sp.]|nr:hypothetical protein [Haliscomenobacter sp.]